jgi:monoamine oxidase
MKGTIVVGSGVAGLAAARELTAHGCEPVVLEARERCGGRILTVHDAASPVPLELGAEFVHGVHPDLWRVLRESNATVVQQEGEHVDGGDGEGVGKVFEAMSRAPEQSFADFIAGVDGSVEVKAAATGFVEGFNAALKEDVSVEWLNQETDDEPGFRVLSGYDAVPNFLARGLDIRYSTPVRRLRWKRGEVVAETDRGEFRGAQAIVTAPLAAMCEIDPEPEALRRARAAIAAGQAIRITFRFRDAVWDQHPRMSFLQGDAPFRVWWTQHPVIASVITGWAAGPRALALRGKTPDELRDVALDSLRKILDADPGEPVASYFHDWAADPWSRAAYSYVRVNGMAAQRAFGLPIEGTLCFAGEAAAPEAGHVGTVHGAIASGIAAARRLVTIV